MSSPVVRTPLLLPFFIAIVLIPTLADTADDSSKYHPLECTMCAACNNPCPHYLSPPPPPPSQPTTYPYYSPSPPPPPSQPTTYPYYSPSPPPLYGGGGGGGVYYPPPTPYPPFTGGGGEYLTPPPPQPHPSLLPLLLLHPSPGFLRIRSTSLSASTEHLRTHPPPPPHLTRPTGKQEQPAQLRASP